ncbi:ubiquitin carboxyl-terminal hydrolase 45 isoform X1 [Latimeria chalumnae]|uniref:ubiquitin carboxyl-terminal hydrolase 45 isoform X1 n=2 Tax=Latimeria chalumnae TaxID=7897 RepID=UPI00313C7BD8
MRVKDPSSRAVPEMTKRNRRPQKPQDDDSSDDIAGLTCQHVSLAVDVNQVKKAVAQNMWSVCSECIKERKTCDGEPAAPLDVWLCLKCGYQGCSRSSEGQHSLKHFQAAHTEPHCIVINLSTWIVWCYECDEELLTHCNKKAVVQMVDFLQKHATKTGAGSSKIIKVREENIDGCESLKGKSLVNSTSVPVKGINNLGNTCFFNAVMQNLAQTQILNEMMHEVKEKGPKLKICPLTDANLDPLVVNLPSPGPLTSAMFLFLHSMKEAGKGPLSPKVLFSQLCQKAPRFKSFQQQDSQELLHYLLDAIRVEETKRIQTGILKAFNNPTTKTADEETRRKVKAYGKEGVKGNFIDCIFVGELTSTIMCEECEHISTVKEPFINLSLPIIEERVSKPVPSGRTSKNKGIQDAETGQHTSVTVKQERSGTSPVLLSCQSKNTRKASSTTDKNQQTNERRSVRKPLGEEERNNGYVQQKKDQPQEDNCSVPHSESLSTIAHPVKVGSQSECSEKDLSQSESSNDADSEASECEASSKLTVPLKNNKASTLKADEFQHTADTRQQLHSKQKDCTFNDTLSDAISKLNLSNNISENYGPANEDTLHLPHHNSDFAKEKSVIFQNPQAAFQTLSHCYIPSSKECSIQSCLYQFTSVELLMGNNKLLCENCTERRPKHQKKINCSEKKTENMYTNTRKQFLISSVPPILTLHLKRFHQAGLSLRKINKHVDFPVLLDLAPFCSASCKNIADGERVLYSLYGIVEHSGSMRGGHYTAYVKVRAHNKKVLDHISGNRNISGLKESVGAPAGQWVYVSDTYIQTVPEPRVLNSQAYLLFYERLLQ